MVKTHCVAVDRVFENLQLIGAASCLRSFIFMWNLNVVGRSGISRLWTVVTRRRWLAFMPQVTKVSLEVMQE